MGFYAGITLCSIYLLLAVSLSEQMSLDELEVVGQMSGSVTEFLGIRYASASRFTPPSPLNLTKIMAEYGAACMQSTEMWQRYNLTPPETSFNETCLFLNVFVNGSVDANARKPVMVGIHGGDFRWGAAEMIDGNAIAAHGDVIVVTFNYRLGLEGFFTSGDDVIPGNMGLLDQRMALQWVQENIEKFGGDKDRVTVFGHEAGAISASLHVLSPGSSGLFQRAIMASGFAPSYRYWEKEDLEDMSVDLTATCKDEADKLTCIQNLDIDTLKFNATDLGFPLRPVIDGELKDDDDEDIPGFLPEHPSVILSKWKYNVVDVLAGLTEQDGRDQLLRYTYELSFSKTEVTLILAKLKLSDDNMFGLDVRQLVLDQYFDDLSNMTGNGRALVQTLTDKFSLAPIVGGLRELAVISNTYLYYVTEGEDRPFLFSGYEGRISEAPDNSSVKMLLAAWVNFAKTGVMDSSGAMNYLPGEYYQKLDGMTGTWTTEMRLQPRGTSFWNRVVGRLTANDYCQDDTASLISRAGAETALFLLILLTVCLLLAILVMFANRTQATAPAAMQPGPFCCFLCRTAVDAVSDLGL